jgi:sensitive to high expression protein 9
MQSLPQLLRQTLRPSLHLPRTTPRTFRPAIFNPAPRSFSACLQCQFRPQPGSFADFNDRERISADTERLIREKEKELADLELASRDPVPIPGVEAGSSFDGVPPLPEPETAQNKSEEGKPVVAEDGSASASGTSGGLPSYLESRRSKWSKQFDTIMDNLQSNVFVAGQRLNDLTGYSSIEALKNDIQFQGVSPAELQLHYNYTQNQNQKLIPARGPPPHCACTRQTC